MPPQDIQQAIPGIAAIGKTNGSFPLLDELMVGMPKGIPHGPGDIGLTEDEARTHFAIWCMMASPLWITHNIFQANITGRDGRSYNVNDIVAHDEALAINQDSKGEMATRIDGASHSGHGLANRIPLVCEGAAAWPNGEQLARPLSNGDWALLLFNRLNSSLTMTHTFTDIGDTTQTSFAVRDVWARKSLGNFTNTFVARDVPPHGNVFLRLRAIPPPPPPTCPPGYTSHAPGFWPAEPSYPCHGGDCDMSNATCSLGGPGCQFGVGVLECAKQCSGPPPPGIAPGLRCSAFEVYDPQGVSACFNFFGKLTEVTADESCFAGVNA